MQRHPRRIRSTPLLALPLPLPGRPGSLPLGAECFLPRGLGCQDARVRGARTGMGKSRQSCFGKEGTRGVPMGWVSGGSVCLAMHMLGEGVSTHGAGDCEHGEQQTRWGM